MNSFILDFLPAVNNMIPLTPNHDSQPRTSSANSMEEVTNDEITNLHQQYRKLVEKNRE